jgi:type I restriction enzyme R subunit
VEAKGEELGGNSKEAAAEAIENNIRKKIVEKILINPKYYENLSTILDKLIKERHEGALAYEALLDMYISLVKNLENPELNPHYPESIRKSKALMAFYDNFGEDEELSIALDQAVRDSKEADFRHNPFKERRIKNALYGVLKDVDMVEQVYNLVVEQSEY